MILFHGSDKIVEKPMANYGRNKVDFGQGFYLTSIHEQALGQLQYKKVNHQICIRSQEVLDRMLQFVRWEEV